MSEELNSIINQPDRLLIENYFEFQKEAEKRYGKNTVVFMEVGSFMEIYEAESIGKASEIAKLLNILLTRKNKSIQEITFKNPSLAGLPNVSFDKHLERIINENKYTVILIKQVGTTPNITRKIEKIISPGTNTSFLKSDDYNFISSIYLEKNKQETIYGGLSLIDLSTGKTIVYESYGNIEDKHLFIDEIHNILQSYGCSEVIISGDDIDDDEKLKVLSSLNLDNISYTLKSDKDIKKSLNINYQNELLTKIFGSDTFLSAIEELDLERYPHALNSLVILLDFIIEHDKRTVNKLLKPEIHNAQKKLYIGNQALHQLNISDENGLIKYVNKGITAIGKRYISEQLLNPLTDRYEIQKRYLLSSIFINNPLKKEVSDLLKDFYDIERIWRKFQIETISPFEVVNFYKSLKKISDIYSLLSSNETTSSDFTIEPSDSQVVESILSKIENSFFIETMSMFSLVNINKNFINPNISAEIKSLEKSLKESYKKVFGPVKGLELIFENENLSYILNYLKTYESSESPREYKGEFVGVGFNDSEGFYLELTNKRYLSKKEEIIDFFDNYFNGSYTKKELKGSIKFYFKELETLSDEIVLKETKLINTCKKVFTSICAEIAIENEVINNIVLYVSKLDFYINNANLFEKNAYVIPEIVESENNFIEAIELRHAIVEKINLNEVYVTNDVLLGDKNMFSPDVDSSVIFQDDREYVNGLLLYGLNSSGKSTLSKSIGVAVLMAQAGFFVSAKRFRYSLFDSLFSRITGEDNLHKGLSTFAIEMLELKNIFNRAGKRSLVISDELSRGTETVSGLALVSSAIKHLNERGVFFIMATHMHDLQSIPEVSSIDSVVDVHLSVHYNEEEDSLIYNRKLQSGSGSSLYGLEFAKYLHLDKNFLKTAYDIRNRLASDIDDVEALSRGKKSTYNASVFLKECEICGEKGDEIHHIFEKHTADDNGMIEHIHKNHKSNLVCLCEKHHDMVHRDEIFIEGWKITSSGRKLIWIEH